MKETIWANCANCKIETYYSYGGIFNKKRIIENSYKRCFGYTDIVNGGRKMVACGVVNNGQCPKFMEGVPSEFYTEAPQSDHF